MAQVISIGVYDFNNTGNAFGRVRTMGLPVEGMHVRPVAETERNTLDHRVYVYSKIHYPSAAPASEAQNGYFVFETVAQVLAKANA